MIGYVLALFPLYIFVYVPVSQFLGFSAPFSPSSSSSSSSSPSSSRDGHADHIFDVSFIALEDPDLKCPPHTYTTHILSREPLVLYLEGWLSEGEIAELLDISADQFAPSHVSTGSELFIDPAIRLSDVATLPRSHAVQCIEARARALQGWGSGTGTGTGTGSSGTAPSPAPPPPPPPPPPSLSYDNDNGGGGGGLLLERLKIQRYGPGGHYTHHYDWQGAGRVDRASSFMVYVDANCTGGGTGFPRLRRPRSNKWCGFADCAADEDMQGLVFRPVRGNAIFWENLRPDGTGYEETWHAGLPVETGTKIGLNIWTWSRF